MGKAITDYVKFLAEARDAVYRLNCDENTADQLRGQEAQEERELEAARKEAADTIEQTVQSRINEISSSYDSEIQKEQERLKKARARREKAKNKGIKDRIFDETKGLREERRDLQLQLKTQFQKDRVPAFYRSSLFYALYYPRSLKEILAVLGAVLVCFLALPCGIYFMIPEKKLWQLVLIYFITILIFGGLYVKLGNHARHYYGEALKAGRLIRSSLRANQKKIHVITRTIQKDGDENIYNLEKYDDEISCIEQELLQISQRKKDALGTFENVTKNILSDEIEGSRREQLQQLEKKLEETSEALRQLESSIKEQNIYITDTYGPYLGKEFLNPDRIAELSHLISDKTASNITEAIEIIKRNQGEM